MKVADPVKAIDLLSSQLEQRMSVGKLIAHGRRALLIDPSVFDALHTELAGFLGEDEARGALNRLGYAMGHSAARRLRDRYHWNDEQEWIAACPILMSWSGLASAKLNNLAFDPSRGSFQAEFAWTGSYESEQHLHHSGVSQSPVCWMLVGYVSGYCSLAADQRLLCLEMECVGKGDIQCIALVKPIAAWGDAARKSATDLVRFEALHKMHSLHEQLRQKENLSSEQQRAALTEALKEARLKALESQVNPHFLFNTINVITKLAFLEGAAETEAMTYALADLMRYSLGSSSDTNGLAATRYVHQLYPATKVAIVSAYDKFDYAQEALRAGAVDYLLKPVRTERLVALLKKLCADLDAEDARKATASAFLEEGASDYEQRSPHYTALRRAEAYIAENYARGLTLKQVAAHATMAPTYFSRIFKQEMGSTFTEYLTRIRLKEAKHLLSTTTLPIAEIAYAVGYQGPNYLTEVFKAVEGITPGAYRRTHSRP